LTTNLDASIDPALRRRLAAHITFGAPEYDERLRLWKQMLSVEAAYDKLDLDELASEFEDLTGANIRNAVLAAAFLAAGEDKPIGQEHLVRGARGEYRAMGRVLGKGQRR
jgi:SpoVK/Ycf46/Vps4 family AAA+-type ATPase